MPHSVLCHLVSSLLVFSSVFIGSYRDPDVYVAYTVCCIYVCLYVAYTFFFSIGCSVRLLSEALCFTHPLVELILSLCMYQIRCSCSMQIRCSAIVTKL